MADARQHAKARDDELARSQTLSVTIDFRFAGHVEQGLKRDPAGCQHVGKLIPFLIADDGVAAPDVLKVTAHGGTPFWKAGAHVSLDRRRLMAESPSSEI
jgi:hypothetical protein